MKANNIERFRIIPVLLIQNGGLVKSIRFKNHTYIGDPINAVKIFNDKEVDELVILDISATQYGVPPNLSKIQEITSEAFMPLGYGGGIQSLDQVKNLIAIGVEKVIFNYAAVHQPDLIYQAAKLVGSQSIVVSIDVKKNWLGRTYTYTSNGNHSTKMDPIEFAKKMENQGAGELIIQSIDRDGTFKGYDLKLIQELSNLISIPIIALGGAGTLSDFQSAIQSGASAVGAGSLFVFQGPHRAVLINYPSPDTLQELYSN